MPTPFFSYYEYLWLRNKGVDASSLFEGLPLSLQADISHSMYKDLIERVKTLLLFFINIFNLFSLCLPKDHITCNKTNSVDSVDIVKKTN